MTNWSIFIEFAILALVIGASGYFLSLYGDVIAEKTGLGGTWVGFAMLATVTSLPELVTGVSAVTYVGAPDIALGDALGSCVFNLLLLWDTTGQFISISRAAVDLVPSWVSYWCFFPGGF